MDSDPTKSADLQPPRLDQPHSEASLATGAGSWHQWQLWLAGLIGSRYDGLRHFHVVDAGKLLRCGQPHVRDLDVIRTQHGLKTIVAARGGTRHPLRGSWFHKQRRWCAANGVQLIQRKLSDKSPPPPDLFAWFLDLCREPANHPILVHCEQGFHRTGILCAAYRLGVNRWSLEQTLAEMKRCGFDPAEEKRRPLRDALFRWAEKLQGASEPRNQRDADPEDQHLAGD